MKEGIILDDLKSTPPTNKWKVAFLSILLLAGNLLLLTFLEDYIPLVIGVYAVKLFVLYSFFKKINLEEINMGQLFSWGIFIIFGGNLLSNIVSVLLFSELTLEILPTFIAYNLGTLFRSIILGSTLSLGIYHLIKNKSFSMLMLMILSSWLFQTLFIFDPAVFLD